MHPAIFITLVISAFGTSVVSAAIGMSGGVVLLSIMTLFFPISIVVPLHGTVQLFSNTMRIWYLRSHVRRDFIIPYLLGVPIGLFPAILLIQRVSFEKIPLFLVATLIFYVVFRPKSFPSLKINPRWFAVHGAIAAFLGLFVGAVDPFLSPFFIRDDLSKEQVVATKAVMQFSVHLTKIPSFLYLGFPYENHGSLIIVLVMAAGLGTRYGVLVLKNLKPEIFNKLFKFFMFLTGLRLYYKIFFE